MKCLVHIALTDLADVKAQPQKACKLVVPDSIEYSVIGRML